MTSPNQSVSPCICGKQDCLTEPAIVGAENQQKFRIVRIVIMDGQWVKYADHVAEVALKDQEIARLRTFLLRIASIPDDKYSRHDKWVRGLGIEARKLLADYKEVQS